MQTQNTFDENNTLEVLAFDGNVIEIPTKQMRSLDNTPVVRSKPSSLLRFSFDECPVTSNSGNNFLSIEPLNVVRFKS